MNNSADEYLNVLFERKYNGIWDKLNYGYLISVRIRILISVLMGIIVGVTSFFVGDVSNTKESMQFFVFIVVVFCFLALVHLLLHFFMNIKFYMDDREIKYYASYPKIPIPVLQGIKYNNIKSFEIKGDDLFVHVKGLLFDGRVRGLSGEDLSRVREVFKSKNIEEKF